jgi:hypothetical protein
MLPFALQVLTVLDGDRVLVTKWADQRFLDLSSLPLELAIEQVLLPKGQPANPTPLELR